MKSNARIATARLRRVGFSDWLDDFIDMHARVLNGFAIAVCNDNIPIARAEQQLNFRLA
jgi:hypothetical protein